MKLRFLAAAGPAGARQRLAARLAEGRHEGLIAADCAAPLSLWVEAGTPLLKSPDGTAVAVGLLLDRSSGKPLSALPSGQTAESICIHDCWGCYVLFAAERTSQSILRDPSGSLPVYYGTDSDLQLYASDADMLARAWPGPFRPNLEAARHWLRFPFLRTARTGALGVAELLPGMVREVGDDRDRLRPAWRPQPFAAADRAIKSFDEAETLLREAVLRSVPSLAAGRPNVVLQLSGGLDSSIVAAALSLGGVDYRAITFATRSADGDERRYAREVARHFGFDLEELSEADVDLSVRTSSGPLRRPPSPLLQALRRPQLAAAESDALLLDGGGGDNVFASINSVAPAIDALRRCGIAEAVKTVRNIAARHGCTFWEAAAAALRRARSGGMIRWIADDTFLTSPPIPEMPDLHPWLEPSNGRLPGSADHLRMVTGVHHFFIDPAPDQPCNLHPLICQPILETCLRIGSWLWFEGGRDRAVARAAFRDILPHAILDRRGKGSLQNMFVTGFTAIRAELRDYLVAGRLADEGIIDAGAVAAYLDRCDEPRDVRHVRILEIASAEQWLRSFG